MLTAGQIITNVGRFYLNVSAAEQTKDPAKRARIAFGLREVMTRAWTLAPLSQRHGNGSVTVQTTGIGPFPSDFSGLGTQSSVFFSTGGQFPLVYMEEQDLLRNATLYPDQGQPRYYTRIRGTIAGVPQIRVWPPPTAISTLTINVYNRRCLDAIDFPPLPTITIEAGVIPVGDYKWKMAYEWADGTTEGSIETSKTFTLTDGSQAAILIPLSESRYVTGATIFRTMASGQIFLKVGSVGSADIVWSGGRPYYSVVDDVIDSALGPGVCPMPGDAGVATGIEPWPDDFIESTLFLGAVARVAGQAGDMRDAGFMADFKRECMAMWRDQKPGQESAKQFPEFGQFRGASGLESRFRFPQ